MLVRLCSLGDLLRQVLRYMDLVDLLRLEQLNRSCRLLVLCFIEEVSASMSAVRLLTFRHRSDFRSVKDLCVRAWRTTKAPTGQFLLVGGCFVGDLGAQCCKLSVTTTTATASRNDGSDRIDLRCEVYDRGSIENVGALAMAVSSSGQRLVLGGWDNNSTTSLDNISCLDPRNLEAGWRRTSWVTPEKLCFSAATSFVDGSILFSGGSNTPYRGAYVSNRCYYGQFDGLSQPVWHALPKFSVPRCGHSVVTLFDGSVVSIGGYSGDLTYLSSLERLDLNADAWIPLPSMDFERSGAACAVGHDGCIYVAGGSTDGDDSLRSLERLDIREGKWQRLRDMHSERGYTAGCIGNSERFYVSGGLQGEVVVDTVECYEPKMDVWLMQSSVHVATLSPDPNDGSVIDMTEDSPLLRAGHSMIYLWE